MTKMTTMKMLALLLVAALLAGATPAAAQTPAENPPAVKRPFSEKLGWAGVFTMMGGAMLMVPWKTEAGAEDWNLFGEDVCVITQYQGTNGNNGNKFDIQHHPCDTTTPLIKAGLITMGVGGAVALIGFHKVTVKPQVGYQVIGAKVSVKW